MNEYECPHCKADLRGEPIPEELRRMYAPGSTHYSRLIGIEIPELYDGVSYYECPECHVRWDRWTGVRIVTSQARRIAIQKGG
jgi:DNA-directed RNA polymerase subunit RPC12/RpoP